MKELGEFLKKTREEKGISLKDIQDRTKIRSRYLEAIEKGEFQIVPGEVYLRGFLRSYAECIGLNGFEVVDEYKKLVAVSHEDEEEPQVAVESDEVKPWKARHLWVWIPLILLIGFFIWWFIHRTFS